MESLVPRGGPNRLQGVPVEELPGLFDAEGLPGSNTVSPCFRACSKIGAIDATTCLAVWVDRFFLVSRSVTRSSTIAGVIRRNGRAPKTGWTCLEQHPAMALACSWRMARGSRLRRAAGRGSCPRTNPGVDVVGDPGLGDGGAFPPAVRPAGAAVFDPLVHGPVGQRLGLVTAVVLDAGVPAHGLARVGITLGNVGAPVANSRPGLLGEEVKSRVWSEPDFP